MNRCPKCRGWLRFLNEMHGSYESCFMCGYARFIEGPDEYDEEAERKLRRSESMRPSSQLAPHQRRERQREAQRRYMLSKRPAKYA